MYVPPEEDSTNGLKFETPRPSKIKADKGFFIKIRTTDYLPGFENG